jgi:Domain of unknown function (DUF4440)
MREVLSLGRTHNHAAKGHGLRRHFLLGVNMTLLHLFFSEQALRQVSLVFAFGIVAAPPSHAQPATQGQSPVMTRYMKVFMEQETQLLQAVKEKNNEAMEKMLAVNFEMRTSHQAGVPVPRAEWMKSALAPVTSSDYTISQMAVQEVGTVAIASFVLTPSAANKAAAAAFIVDTWVPEGEGWKLRVRHASSLPTLNTKQGRIMGDAATSVDLQKKY